MRPSLLNSRVSSPISYGTCSLRVVRTFPVCLKILPLLSFLLVLLLLCLLLLLLRLALAPSKPPTLMTCVCSLLSCCCISLRLDWIKTRFRLDHLYCLYHLCRRRRRSRLRRSRRCCSKNRFVADPSSSEGWISSSSRASFAFEKNDHQSRDDEEQY